MTPFSNLHSLFFCPAPRENSDFAQLQLACLLTGIVGWCRLPKALGPLTIDNSLFLAPCSYFLMRISTALLLQLGLLSFPSSYSNNCLLRSILLLRRSVVSLIIPLAIRKSPKNGCTRTLVTEGLLPPLFHLLLFLLLLAPV